MKNNLFFVVFSFLLAFVIDVSVNQPESNILIFRFGESDEQQQQIHNALLAEGTFHTTFVNFKRKVLFKTNCYESTNGRKTFKRIVSASKRIIHFLGQR